MLTEFETSFTVYPTDANCMTPMIFGGAFFSQLDKAAATAVRRLLYSSPTCKAAVTHKFEGTYHKPCYIGNLIFIKAQILSLGQKSVVIQTHAYRELNNIAGTDRELVADAKFVFVTVEHDEDVGGKPETLPYFNHGLTMPTD